MDEGLRSAIVAEALSWVNTEYHPHARLKGVGVDCAMLLAEVYEQAGAIPRVEPGYYPAQFGLHRDDEIFESVILQYGKPVDVPRPGDCALFRVGRCYSHGGIMVEPTRFVHAVAPPVGRVVLTDLADAEVASLRRRFYEVTAP